MNQVMAAPAAAGGPLDVIIVVEVQRSYNASIYHDFPRGIQTGGYFSLSNSATYNGQKDTDIPIGEHFSGDPGTTPVTR